jgi:hypothetical protein
MRVERLSASAYADALPDSGTELFHDPAALDTLERHAAGELVLLGGFKGDQPVALLPAFVTSYSVGRTVLSPPPGMGVPRLGPVLFPASPKRRKREQLNRAFTEAVVEELDLDATGTLFRMVCNAGYDDPRPHDWAGLAVEPQFTYRLSATAAPPGELLASFSKSLRREIRDAEELELTVSVEGIEGAREVYEDTRARYEEQGREFGLTWPYVRDLVTALEDRARVYVARTPDGAFLSGITVLYSPDAAYFWQGGARAVHEGVSVNGLLHWRVIEGIATDPPTAGVTHYDLMGANTERLCRYKSKFGADLVPYYVVESGGRGMRLAKRAYRLVAR